MLTEGRVTDRTRININAMFNECDTKKNKHSVLKMTVVIIITIV